jgi:hypothetical protein
MRILYKAIIVQNSNSDQLRRSKIRHWKILKDFMLNLKVSLRCESGNSEQCGPTKGKKSARCSEYAENVGLLLS